MGKNFQQYYCILSRVCNLVCSPKQTMKGTFMKKLFFFLVFILAGVGVYGQNIVGKIHVSAEADGLYGPVSVSVPIETSALSDLLKVTDGYIMFRIDKGNLTVLDNKRTVIYPKNAEVKDSDLFRYFSVSLVSKLITGGQASVTTIELRNFGILSLTNGQYTLEFGSFCPPDCI